MATRAFKNKKKFRKKYVVTTHGYRMIFVNGKYQLMNRYVMERKIKRKLTNEEFVHHINGNKLDNNIKNLEIISNSAHSSIHNYGKKASEETKEKFRLMRKDTNQKVNHPQWKQSITKEAIESKANQFKSLKDLADSFSISADTLRARMKYYGLIKGDICR